MIPTWNWNISVGFNVIPRFTSRLQRKREHDHQRYFSSSLRTIALENNVAHYLHSYIYKGLPTFKHVQLFCNIFFPSAQTIPVCRLLPTENKKSCFNASYAFCAFSDIVWYISVLLYIINYHSFFNK